MTTPEDSIRARRRLTNKLIAARDADRLRPFIDPGAVLIAGDGSTLMGRDAILEAFAAQFADSEFVSYVRETTGVALDPSGERAAEHGRWSGRWRSGDLMGGDYLAVWRKVTGQWVIERELYVTLR
jgi:ketosteroid isomerase-like protein